MDSREPSDDDSPTTTQVAIIQNIYYNGLPSANITLPTPAPQATVHQQEKKKVLPTEAPEIAPKPNPVLSEKGKVDSNVTEGLENGEMTEPAAEEGNESTVDNPAPAPDTPVGDNTDGNEELSDEAAVIISDENKNEAYSGNEVSMSKETDRSPVETPPPPAADAKNNTTGDEVSMDEEGDKSTADNRTLLPVDDNTTDGKEVFRDEERRPPPTDEAEASNNDGKSTVVSSEEEGKSTVDNLQQDPTVHDNNSIAGEEAIGTSKKRKTAQDIRDPNLEASAIMEIDEDEEVEDVQKEPRDPFNFVDNEFSTEPIYHLNTSVLTCDGTFHPNDVNSQSTPKRRGPKRVILDGQEGESGSFLAPLGEPPKKLMSRKKIRTPRDEDSIDDFGETTNPVKEMEKSIVNNLSNAAGNCSFNGDFLQVLVLSKADTRSAEEKEAVKNKLNEQLEDARGRVKAAVDDGKIAIAASGRRKANAEAAKEMESLVIRTRDIIQGIAEKPKLIHTDDIEWDLSVKQPTEEEVRTVMYEITNNIRSSELKDIRGYMKASASTGRMILFVTSGVEVVLAFRKLADRLYEQAPEKYIPREEDTDDLQLRATSSQPTVSGSEGCTTASRSQPADFAPAADKRITNPWIRVVALVTEETGCSIPTNVITQIKTLQSPKQRVAPVWETIDMLRGATDGLAIAKQTQKTMSTQLKLSNISFNEVTLRVIVNLPQEAADLLKEVAKKYEQFFNNQTFCKLVLAAYAVSAGTTKDILRKMKDGTLDVVKGEQMLEEHKTRIGYLMVGKGLLDEDASVVEEQMETGKAALSLMKMVTGKKKKLCFEKLSAMKFEAEAVLLEMERDLVGFKKATVTYRSCNDVETADKHGRCLLNIISLEDFVKQPQIFAKAAKSSHLCIFLVTDATKKEVIDVISPICAGIGARELPAQCTQHPVGTGSLKFMKNSVPTVLIGARNKKVWDETTLNKELINFGIASTITNWITRQLLYDQQELHGTIRGENKFNCIFAHSSSDSVLAIISDTAPRRVFTSIASTSFATGLNKLQKARTADGGTFRNAPKPQKKTKEVDDD